MWSGGALTTVLLIAAVCPWRVGIPWVFPGGGSVTLLPRGIVVSSMSCPPPGYNVPFNGFVNGAWPRVETTAFGTSAVIPFWTMSIAVGAPTVLLARWNRKPRTLNSCHLCGYDLTGNVSGKCSECGIQVAPQNAGGRRRTDAPQHAAGN